jgi:hypothetical protein
VVKGKKLSALAVDHLHRHAGTGEWIDKQSRDVLPGHPLHFSLLFSNNYIGAALIGRLLGA